MTIEQQVFELKRVIREYKIIRLIERDRNIWKELLDNPDWATTGSVCHIECRKSAREKLEKSEEILNILNQIP